MESSMSLMLFFEVLPSLNSTIWKIIYTSSMLYGFFLTLLFTFWQKYKSCTSTSGSIISYQVRCKCVTLWQVGLFRGQKVFNFVMLGSLVSGLCKFIHLSSKFQQNAHFIWNENFPLPELCLKKEWRYYRLLCLCNN